MLEEEKNVTRGIKYTFIVIGGGIAGITCVETLTALNPQAKILLITPHTLIKKICNHIKITNHIDSFDVALQDYTEYNNKYPNINIIVDTLLSINTIHKEVYTGSGGIYIYTNSICLCTGSRPNIIQVNSLKTLNTNFKHPLVITLRDNSSVTELRQLLKNSRRIIICGNGGIATELVYKIKNCEIIWAIKDDCITKKFLDPGASEYIISNYMSRESGEAEDFKVPMSMVSKPESPLDPTSVNGQSGLKPPASALGPNWHINMDLAGSLTPTSNQNDIKAPAQIIYNTEIVELQDIPNTDPSGFPLRVTLSNGVKYECDFVISATGVIPNSTTFSSHPDKLLRISPEDMGILVDSKMRTNVPGIYAAGDCCTVETGCVGPNWFQMRLWTQAYHMGYLAAQCMSRAAGDPDPGDGETGETSMENDIYFELFTHTTTFFGRKVVLLGIYNGQRQLPGPEYLVRVGAEGYIKVALSSSTGFGEDLLPGGERKYIRGAILIGNTGMEETLENLILNRIDVAPYGADLLDPDIDIEDYFD